MTFSEFSKIVDSVTYKPGYRIMCHAEMASEYVRLVVVAKVKDVFDPDKEIPLTTAQLINLQAIPDLESAKFYIKRTVQILEMHELDEWLKIDGICVTDPHPAPKAA